MVDDTAPLTPAELSQLRAILDRDSIRRVVEGYARGMDRCDEGSARAAYWEDGYDNHGLYKGNAQEFLTWGLGLAKEYSGQQHQLGQSTIVVDGDAASAETYFVHYAEYGRAPLPNRVTALAGRYVDTFERRGADWKIIDRVVVIDWSTVWGSGERFPGVEAFVPGNWYPEDEADKKRAALS